MGTHDRILYFLLAALVACLPFEVRSLPLLSDLQWLFLCVGAVALPILIRERKKLFQNRLVLAALVFVVIQWLAALLSAEFTLNSIKGAVRDTVYTRSARSSPRVGCICNSGGFVWPRGL